MQPSQSKEQRGRRALWQAEISRAISYLETAERNNHKFVELAKAGVTEQNQQEWLDLRRNFEACIEMSIVCFCTFYNKGDGRSRAAASNNSNVERNLLEDSAFPDAKKREEYEELRDRLKKIRDGILAHSSAEAHEVTHDSVGGVGASGYGEGAWRDVDRVFFHAALKRLDYELLNGGL